MGQGSSHCTGVGEYYKRWKKIEAVAQVTKSGFIFLLDRKTGTPVYPINETKVPVETDLAGEQPWATQPIPSFPKPFVRQLLTEEGLNHLFLILLTRILNKDGRIQTMITCLQHHLQKGTIIFPGFDGGAEWGGPSFDPSTGILYVNASEMAWILTMVDIKNKPITKEKNIDAGKRIYTTTTCMACHGTERQGSGNNPTLININKKYTEKVFMNCLLQAEE
jgi:quinoprotein glucose dehydrogenase